MSNLPELILEAIKTLTALLVLYLGLRIMLSMRLTLHRRSIYLFIAASVLFALQEGMAFVINPAAHPGHTRITFTLSWL